MFDLVRNNKKFIQVVLALIILPFALWGVDSYVSSSGGGDSAAKVGETAIGVADFQQSLREQQDRLRPQLGENPNPALLESPELRRGVLQELINQRLLLLFASESRLRVGDEAVVSFITSVPALQDNGKFSRERYEALVAAQGMSVEMFESRVRQDLMMQQALMAAGNGAFGGRVPADRWLAAQLEEREIREHLLRAEQFSSDSKPDGAAVKRYYEEQRGRFEKPEQVRVEYLVLNQAKLIETAQIAETDVKAWYQANEARFKKEEQRQASHILFRVDKKAPEAEAKAAQEKAEKVLSELKANPADFAKLAKQHSQDPGSAGKGGDLGYFGRGMMVKPFEESVFALKEGELSGLVRSDFGFHLIKLTGIRPEQARPLDEVRGEIVAELRRQAGAKRFAEAAEGFANTVYEQSDSLKPAAEKYKLDVQTSDWIVRGGQVEVPFTHPKLMQAVFSDDAVKNRRNTEAIDVGNNTLVSARVVEHRPAAVEPLEKVAAVIEKLLMLEAAGAKATASGQAQLEKLAKGEKVDLDWSAVRTVSRMHAPNLSGEARAAVFSAPVSKLPAYAGAKVPGGFALYRIDQVRPFDEKVSKETESRVRALRQHYAEVVAQEELVGWLAALRQRYPVSINTAVVDRKE
jgi:peptidyl-prolyl cis-trans isomerase D